MSAFSNATWRARAWHRAKARSCATIYLPQSVKVSGDVPGLRFRKTELRHGSPGLHALRRHNPVHEVLRCVWKVSTNVGPSSERLQRRPDNTLRATNSRDSVALSASICGYRGSSTLRRTAGSDGVRMSSPATRASRDQTRRHADRNTELLEAGTHATHPFVVGGDGFD
jgi:hypothetical protein